MSTSMTTVPVAERDTAFEDGLRAARSGPARVCPHVIEGVEDRSGPRIDREDPCRVAAVVSACHDAPRVTVAAAIEAARRASVAWGEVDVGERVELLRGALRALTPERLTEMAVAIALETGKSRAESYLEAEELRVLLEIYCDAAAAPDAFEDPLAPGAKGASRSTLRPYGAFGIVAPFNYPMVLGAAPAVAAILAGNAVVLKPSHLGPASAQTFVDLMRDCDLPPGVLNVVHGGDDAGRALIGGAIDGAVFTGSAEVGLEIVRAMQGGRYPRPAIAEMGGNNPVVVTDSADLEQAAEGIAISAFGASGQRCSACSRVIVTPGAHDRLLELLAERAAGVAIGDPIDPGTFAGPLITRASVSQFENVVAHAVGDGELVAGGRRPSDVGHYVDATVIRLPRGHALTRREHFMPLVSVVEAPDFEQALTEANATDLGLTAGIYTRDRDEAHAFLAGAEAGCVNVNVPGAATTGWWPGVQTFGGWKGSGSTGKHAFGRWYLGQFAREQCRTVGSGFEL